MSIVQRNISDTMFLRDVILEISENIEMVFLYDMFLLSTETTFRVSQTEFVFANWFGFKNSGALVSQWVVRISPWHVELYHVGKLPEIGSVGVWWLLRLGFWLKLTLIFWQQQLLLITVFYLHSNLCSVIIGVNDGLKRESKIRMRIKQKLWWIRRAQ